MKVFLGVGKVGVRASREMAMGKWSEEREVMVDHLASRTRWSRTIVRSGEDGLPPDGSREGESSLMRQKVLSRIWSWKAAPLDAAPEEEVPENHALW